MPEAFRCCASAWSIQVDRPSQAGAPGNGARSAVADKVYLPDSNLVGRHVGPIGVQLVAKPGYMRGPWLTAKAGGTGGPSSPDAKHRGLAVYGWRQGYFGSPARAIQGRQRRRARRRRRSRAGGCLPARCLSHDSLASEALVPIMTDYPPPPAGVYLVRPPGQHPARKIRVLTKRLIEYFGKSPHFAGAASNLPLE